MTNTVLLETNGDRSVKTEDRDELCGSAVEAANTPQEQVNRFVSCLYEPGDILEIRRLPAGNSSWHRADELAATTTKLVEDNESGQHICVGANPRTQSGGKRKKEVSLARSVYVDFDDGIKPKEAMIRIHNAKLPRPNCVVASGHGVHVYWKLREPTTDWPIWSGVQKRLAEVLGADKSIHDPPRLMRLPGFINHKDPATRSRLILAKAEGKCDLEELQDVLDRISPVQGPSTPTEESTTTKADLSSLERAIHDAQSWKNVSEGQRNNTAYRYSGRILHQLELSLDEAWPVLRAWNRRNSPPLPEEELRRCLENAAKQGSGGTDSLSAPIESEVTGNEFPPPVPASQLESDETLKWIWKGYLARGLITLMTGLWKAGKTTLVAHLLRALGDGENFAGEVTPGNVLVVSEEPSVMWVGRRDELAFGDHVYFYLRPFLGNSTQQGWEAFIDHVAKLVPELDLSLVIIDPLATFSPASDENDSARMMRTLRPLHKISNAGAGVLILHHPRKGDGGEGQASRGSGAVPGFVDIIVELRRHDPNNRQDNRRVLTSYSRVDETPPELVVELTDNAYRCCGTKSNCSQADRMDVIAGILGRKHDDMKPTDIRDAWPDDAVAKPGIRTVEEDLKCGMPQYPEDPNEGELQARWFRGGAGVKTDPYVYRSIAKDIEELMEAIDSTPASPESIGAGIES